MDTILHVVDIQASPAAVFKAVTTAEGLAGWWSTNVKSDGKLGSIVDFTFEADFNPDMLITEMNEPSKLAWRCVAGHDPWLESTFNFDIDPRGDTHTRMIFTQGYGAPIDDVAYGIYNFNWGYYLQSLKQLAETGKGFPHQAR